MERITVWMARVGFLSIAACTFGLSFDAITEVAQQTGAVDPALAWIVPLAVDGMIVTATAVLWTESLTGRGWHMFPLLAIIGPAALSMWANIAHASGQSLLAQVLAAVPPAGLILSLELVAWQIRRERKHVHRPTTSRVQARHHEGDALAVAAQMQTALPAAADTSSARSGASPNGGRATAVDTGDPDDTGRITLDVPADHSGEELWNRIVDAVREADVVPTQRQLANELKVPRSRVQRAIDRNRDEWEELRKRVRQDKAMASAGVHGGRG
jgi:Protein of unknown function (DUF2637)